MLAIQVVPFRRLPQWLRAFGYGFLYWLVFLLVLEPGNVAHARGMGHTLDFGSEAARICVAALLGSSISPLLVALTRRFPLPGPSGWRNAWIHAGGTVGLSFALIVLSCFLAAWILTGQALPSVADVRDQLAGNWLLLVYAICAFTAITSQTRPSDRHERASPAGRVDTRSSRRQHLAAPTCRPSRAASTQIRWYNRRRESRR